MTYSSPIVNDAQPLILDTSVLINLHASKYGVRILSALANPILMPAIVIAELENETNKSNGEHKFIQDLLSSRKVQSADLSEDEYRLYEQLVSATPSIDDGEAATIAIAVSQNMIPIIDERKGRRQAEALCSGQLPGWSLDLFLHPHVISNLGEADSVDALYLELRDGRMRIHEDHCDHVVGIIGSHRALECNSLPSYKTKRQQWHMVEVFSPSAE